MELIYKAALRKRSLILGSSVSTVCHTFLWCGVHVGGDVESGEYRCSPETRSEGSPSNAEKSVKHKYRYCNVHTITDMLTSILPAGRVLAAVSPLVNKHDRFPWRCLMHLRCSLMWECGHCGWALYVLFMSAWLVHKTEGRLSNGGMKGLPG